MQYLKHHIRPIYLLIFAIFRRMQFFESNWTSFSQICEI